MFLAFTSCSSKKIKSEVNKEVAVEPLARDNSDLYQKEQKVLNETQNLSQDQKNRLSLLLQKNRLETQAIDQEILKTKSVLFKTLLAEESPQSKLHILENRLIKLNRKKVRGSISAYKEAKHIVGKSDLALDRTLNLIDTSNKEIHDF